MLQVQYTREILTDFHHSNRNEFRLFKWPKELEQMMVVADQETATILVENLYVSEVKAHRDLSPHPHN